jgi:hypothetical protein
MRKKIPFQRILSQIQFRSKIFPTQRAQKVIRLMTVKKFVRKPWEIKIVCIRKWKFRHFDVQPQNQQQETNGNYEIVHNGEILPKLPVPAPRLSKSKKLNSDLKLPKPKKEHFTNKMVTNMKLSRRKVIKQIHIV